MCPLAIKATSVRFLVVEVVRMMGASKILNAVLLGGIVALLLSEFAHYARTIQLPVHASDYPAAATLVRRSYPRHTAEASTR